MRSSTRSLRATLIAAAVFVVAACGDSDGDAAPTPTTVPDGGLTAVPEDRVLAGSVRTPPPQVDLVALPSLSDDAAAEPFSAAPGNLRVVYFGYTNCPDICPTSMFDVAVGLRKLPTELADRVEVLMVTIDPGRDLPLLDGYVKSFVPGAVAAGTDDLALLDEALEPFGASYEIVPDPEDRDGEPLVEHSTLLYVVDDAGTLQVTWPFGTSSDDMAADLVQLLTTEPAV